MRIIVSRPWIKSINLPIHLDPSAEIVSGHRCQVEWCRVIDDRPETQSQNADDDKSIAHGSGNAVPLLFHVAATSARGCWTLSS